MVEHIIPNNATSEDFATRHGWEPYLCRYRDCPRAIQGFNSSFLRQEHENSHVPRFRCSDTACEVLGSGLVSRAALNKHNKKYHDDNSLAAIPTSLRNASAHPQQDRPRFLLKEPSYNSRKRSFHVVEEVEEAEAKAIGEYIGAIHDAQYIQKLKLSTGENENKRTIRCICGTRDDIYMIECDVCHTMQHVRCYYLDKHGNFLRLKEQHICVDCGSTPVDAELAVLRQSERKRHHSEYLRTAEFTKESQILVKTRSSSWSLEEKQIFQIFVRQHGTNWHKIASDMRSRTWREVYKSLFNNGYTADICRAR